MFWLAGWLLVRRDHLGEEPWRHNNDRQRGRSQAKPIRCRLTMIQLNLTLASVSKLANLPGAARLPEPLPRWGLYDVNCSVNHAARVGITARASRR